MKGSRSTGLMASPPRQTLIRNLSIQKQKLVDLFLEDEEEKHTNLKMDTSQKHSLPHTNRVQKSHLSPSWKIHTMEDIEINQYNPLNLATTPKLAIRPSHPFFSQLLHQHPF
jgi:hypothetical protein